MTVGIKGIRASFMSLEDDLDWFIQEFQELEEKLKGFDKENERLKGIINDLEAQLDKGN